MKRPEAQRRRLGGVAQLGGLPAPRIPLLGSGLDGRLAKHGETRRLHAQPDQTRPHGRLHGRLDGRGDGRGQRAPRATRCRASATPPSTCARSAACDTAGAYGILKAAQAAEPPPKLIARPEVERLFELVEHAVKAEPTPHVQRRPFTELFERIGHGVVHLGYEAFDTMVFFGHLLVAVGRAIANPRKVRWAACFALAERAGLDAIPIVDASPPSSSARSSASWAPTCCTTFGAQVYRGRADRRGGAARVQRADHRPAAGRPLGLVASPPRSAR